MQEVDFQEWPHCPDISETSLASYSGTFLKCMFSPGYLLGSATSILNSGSLTSFYPFYAGSFYPFLWVLIPSFSSPRALPSWWLAAFGCSLLAGFKTVFLERRESIKISLHWLFSVCETPMTVTDWNIISHVSLIIVLEDC